MFKNLTKIKVQGICAATARTGFYIVDDIYSPLFMRTYIHSIQPEFKFSIDEDARIESNVGQVSATDADEGINQEIRYQFKVGGMFLGYFITFRCINFTSKLLFNFYL